jgi:peroxiredoxin
MALVLSLAIALPLLAACGGSDDGKDSSFGLTGWPDGQKTGAEPGSIAPNFSLESASGDTVTLAGFTGKPVVVNFLATWCANCMEEMAALQAVSASGVQVIGVNLRESRETMQGLIASSGATFPIALDQTGKVTRAFKIVNLPGTVVLKPDGTISTVIRGPIDQQTLLEAVRDAGGG